MLTTAYLSKFHQKKAITFSMSEVPFFGNILEHVHICYLGAEREMEKLIKVQVLHLTYKIIDLPEYFLIF